MLAAILRAPGLGLFLGGGDLLGGAELLLDLRHGLLQLFDRVVGQRPGLHDRVEDLLGVVLDVVVQVALEASNVRYRNVVQGSVVPAQIETTSRSIGNGLDWDCFSSSTSRAPRSSCAFDA